MPYLATLPMYDWPEARAETLVFWAAIETALASEEIKAELVFPSTDEEQEMLWHCEKLIFGQTCWGPLNSGQSDYLQVLAQPDFSQFLGGHDAYYRSAIVMRKNDEPACAIPSINEAAIPIEKFNGQRFVYNGKGSLSGFIALQEDLQVLGSSLEQISAELIQSGSHRHSIQMVADGSADFATIDCRSWDLALTHEPAAQALSIVGWTGERLGLPYVCNKEIPDAAKAKMQAVCKTLNLGVT